MHTTTKRRFAPEALVAIILSTLALPMAIPVFRKLLGNNRGFLRDLGFQEGHPGTLLAWVLALLVAAAFIAFAVKRIPPVSRTWRQISWLKGLVFLAAIAAATVEEAFFRRLLMDRIHDAAGGALAQIVISALAFGLAHGLWGLFKRNLMTAIRATVATGVMGGLLAVVYVVGERSLAPCITAHFLITLASEPGLLLAAITRQWRFEVQTAK